MILDGQYPTTIDWPAQNFAATDMITALNIDDPELTESYWLGWIAYDNLPTAFKISRQSIEMVTRVMSFTDVTRPENFDVAIITPTSTASSPNFNNPYTSIYAGDIWRRFDTIPTSNFQVPSTQSRFINKFDVNTIELTRSYIVVNLSIDRTTIGYFMIYMTPAELYDRRFTRTITSSDIVYARGSAVPAGLSFDIDESVFDGTLQTITVSAHTIKFFAGSFGLPEYGRPLTTGGAVGNYYNPLPVVRLHDGDDHTFLIGGTRFFAPSTGWSNGGYRITPATGAINTADFYDSATHTIVGGYEGSISLDDIIAASGNGVYDTIGSDGNFAVQGVGDNRFAMIRRMFGWDEIVTTLSYFMRYCTVQSYDTDNTKYYPAISESNEFLGYLLNGEADRDKLRPWQISGTALDADSDAYTTADKPPYTPGEDDEQNVGASIVRPSTLGVGGTSGFITQYVLTASEIATLGRTLWTSFINPDYWKNFLFSLALDTGSMDMSSLLDYFVSLRVYPFSLINVPSYAATGSPSIYIGSGMVPLTITGSTSLHTINNFADYIDAGSCTVHSAYFHDDFRDFSNVEIMLYLPYCGTVQLNPGDVVGGTLHAQYAIDFATGGCVAYVDLTSADGISYPIAVLPGSIGADVPLSATNAGQIAARFAGDVINFASTVSSNAAADLNARASAATGAITGGASGAVSRSSIGAIATGGINAGIQHASQALDMATRPAIGIPTLSGGRGFSSFGAPQTAYIQIRRGIYKRPQTYDHTVGAPSTASKTIGSLAGLVKGAVDTAGLSCTADEAAEVRTLIAAGIIV